MKCLNKGSKQRWDLMAQGPTLQVEILGLLSYLQALGFVFIKTPFCL